MYHVYSNGGTDCLKLLKNKLKYTKISLLKIKNIENPSKSTILYFHYNCVHILNLPCNRNYTEIIQHNNTHIQPGTHNFTPPPPLLLSNNPAEHTWILSWMYCYSSNKLPPAPSLSNNRTFLEPEIYYILSTLSPLSLFN